MRTEVVIIGGGASGMVAAIIAARNGAKVALVEQKNELGKKLLATGNGRCNFTNLLMNPTCFYSQDAHFIEALLSVYTPQVIIEFFQSLGVLSKDRNGYVYPITDQASSIRDALVAELESLDVRIYLNTAVVAIEKMEETYCVNVETNEKYTISCETLILATGGKSGLTKQTPFHGYTLLKDTKHSVNTLSPALVPLIGQGRFFKKIAGIRTDAKVSALINGQVVGSEVGELQLTDYGVSGIPVFQISRIMTQALKEQPKKTKSSKSNHIDYVTLEVEIDFMPSYTAQALETLFQERREQFATRNMKGFLNGILKDKLASFLLYTARIEEEAIVSQMTEDECKKLIRIMKTFRIRIEDCKDFPQSQVTAGGVPLKEVNQHLESIYHKNLYLTGELLDVDGICGGYNLHFAWATGMLAGERCSK